MKKLFSLIIPILAIFSSCENSDPVRDAMIERSKNLPTVGEVGYDNQSSTSTSMAIYWNAAESITAGAVSYKIQISDDEFFYEGEGGSVKTFERKSKDYPNDAILIIGLTAGQEYYVRVASVYPGPNRTAWVNLCDSKGKQAPVIPGKGIVEQ